MDLLDCLGTCKSSRESLGRAKHQFVNCSLGILAGYRYVKSNNTYPFRIIKSLNGVLYFKQAGFSTLLTKNEINIIYVVIRGKGQTRWSWI